MRNVFLTMLGLILSLTAFLPTTLPAYAQQNATSYTKTQSYLDAAGNAGFGQTSATAGTPGALIARVINVFLGFVGTITFVVFLYGGYLWLTARGNSDQVDEAKKYLFNATLGAAVIVLAYAATYFITNVLYQAASKPR